MTHFMKEGVDYKFRTDIDADFGTDCIELLDNGLVYQYVTISPQDDGRFSFTHEIIENPMNIHIGMEEERMMAAVLLSILIVDEPISEKDEDGTRSHNIEEFDDESGLYEESPSVSEE